MARRGRAKIFDRMAENLHSTSPRCRAPNFSARKSAGELPLVALPVFPSRVFRHGMVSINRRSGIGSPKDLEGRRIGVPIYSMSAAVWMRGHLQHDYGVDLSDSSDGWRAPSTIRARTGTRACCRSPVRSRSSRTRRARSLSDLLESGEIDAIVGTWLPDAIRRNPDVQRLFPDYREVETDYYRRTKIFPIMHLLALRRDVYEAHPFIASSLFDALCAAKERARLRMRDLGTLQYMLPWMTVDLDEIDDVFGGDAWPYGIEPNRPTLEALMTFLADQAIIKAPMPIDDMFVPTYGRYSGRTGRSASQG